MKQYLYIIMYMVGVLFASCSSDSAQMELPDEPVSKETPICFGGSIGDTLRGNTSRTRAAQPLEEVGIKEFKVFGYKNLGYDDATKVYGDVQAVFPTATGYDVEYTAGSGGTTTSNSAGWEYVDAAKNQTIKYWDLSATAYRFMAYAAPDGTSVNINTSSADYHQLEIPYDLSTRQGRENASYISRHWFSNGNTGDGYAQFRSEVKMQFYQPLSRVRFIITGPDGNPLSVAQAAVVTDIAFASTEPQDYIMHKGDIRVQYPLRGTAPSGTASVDELSNSYIAPTGEIVNVLAESGYEKLITSYEETPLLHDDASKKRWYLLLPNPSQKNDFKLTLTQQDIERTAIVPAEYMKWLPGYEYTYVFKLSEVELIYSGYYVVHSKWHAGYVQNDVW